MPKITDYIRVTEVLRPFSGFNKIPIHILQNAADRGTKVHEICSALMEEIRIDFEPSFSGYIQSFDKWREDKIFLERPSRLYCDKYMITGEIDGLYQDNNGIVLIDIKTSAKENKTWHLQGSAYAYLCEKESINISRIEFIKLSKTGDDAEIFTYEKNFDLFLKCLEIYKTFFNDKKDQFLEENDWLEVI